MTSSNTYIVNINDTICITTTFIPRYSIHSMDDIGAEFIMNCSEIPAGSWFLREFITSETKQSPPLYILTIKTNDGIVHHQYFYYKVGGMFEVFDLSNKYRYVTMEKYLRALSKIYGLDINRQVICNTSV